MKPTRSLKISSSLIAQWFRTTTSWGVNTGLLIYLFTLLTVSFVQYYFICSDMLIYFLVYSFISKYIEKMIILCPKIGLS